MISADADQFGSTDFPDDPGTFYDTVALISAIATIRSCLNQNRPAGAEGAR